MRLSLSSVHKFIILQVVNYGMLTGVAVWFRYAYGHALIASFYRQFELDTQANVPVIFDNFASSECKLSSEAVVNWCFSYCRPYIEGDGGLETDSSIEFALDLLSSSKLATLTAVYGVLMATLSMALTISIAMYSKTNHKLSLLKAFFLHGMSFATTFLFTEIFGDKILGLLFAGCSDTLLPCWYGFIDLSRMSTFVTLVRAVPKYCSKNPLVMPPNPDPNSADNVLSAGGALTLVLTTVFFCFALSTLAGFKLKKILYHPDQGPADQAPEALNLEIQHEQVVSRETLRELEKKLKAIEEAELGFSFPEELCCPIARTVMLNPVLAPDGNTYNYSAICEALRRRAVSPITNRPMNGPFTANLFLRNQVHEAIVAKHLLIQSAQAQAAAQAPASVAARPSLGTRLGQALCPTRQTVVTEPLAKSASDALLQKGDDSDSDDSQVSVTAPLLAAGRKR